MEAPISMTFEELEGLLRPLLQQHLQVSTAAWTAAPKPSWPHALKQPPFVLLRNQQVSCAGSKEPAAMQIDEQDSQDAVVSCCWLANSASISTPICAAHIYQAWLSTRSSCIL
jgi:hypothetical protein